MSYYLCGQDSSLWAPQTGYFVTQNTTAPCYLFINKINNTVQDRSNSPSNLHLTRIYATLVNGVKHTNEVCADFRTFSHDMPSHLPKCAAYIWK